jgi:hypothetical protein
MTAREWLQACKLAFDRETDLSTDDMSGLDGCGLPGFAPATVTLAAVARHIRWQCCYLFGGIDQDALAETRHLLVTLRRATIINSPETDRKLLAVLTRKLLHA